MNEPLGMGGNAIEKDIPAHLQTLVQAHATMITSDIIFMDAEYVLYKNRTVYKTVDRVS